MKVGKILTLTDNSKVKVVKVVSPFIKVVRIDRVNHPAFLVSKKDIKGVAKSKLIEQ